MTERGQSAQTASSRAAIFVVCRCMGNRPPCSWPEPYWPLFFRPRGISIIPPTTRGKLPESGNLHQIILSDFNGPCRVVRSG